MKDASDIIPQVPRRSIVFKIDTTEVDLNDKHQRKVPLSSKDDIWFIRSLKENIPHHHYENKMSTRIHNFVEKIEENWLYKLQAVRDAFEETIASIVQPRLAEIYYSTRCLKEELQDVKDSLDKTEDFDSTITNNLKEAWFDALYKWNTDMLEMEEGSSKLLKAAVAEYLSKLVATRHNPSHTFDVMLTLVLELNHIIIGNVQAIIETVHDLGLLWDTHFKDWCVAYYLRAGLAALVIPEEEESVFEEEVLEIEGLAALDCILELILSHSKEITHDQIEFNKPPDLAAVPHLAYLENYWESFKEKEKFVLEVLQSEAQKLIDIKKFSSSLNPDEHSLFAEWAKKAGYGEDAEQRFVRGAEMAVYSIKELKTLMLKAVELWYDLTERLEALKYVIELLHKKLQIQIAASFQEWEIQMNLAIDDLRQAHSLVVLENMWNIQIDKLFLEYKNMLVETLEYEKNTLDMYIPMSRMTFQLFLTAMDVLITKSWVSTNTGRIPESSIISVKDLEDCNFNLSEIITTCVRNARIGYVQSMKFFRDEIHENIDTLDTRWVIKKKADLDWRYELKAEMMIHRMHRMKTDVLDIRTTELKIHEEVLHRHTEAIREKIVALSSIDVAERIQPLVEDFQAVADEVANLNTKVSPGGFPRIIDILEQAKQKYIDLCMRCDHDSQREYEYIDRYFEWMEQINVQLLRDIKLINKISISEKPSSLTVEEILHKFKRALIILKFDERILLLLFSERGNFSSEEVTSFLFVLQRIDKEVVNEKKNIDSKFTKGVALYDMDIGQKIEKFITYMKNTQFELLHKSNMRFLLNRAKRAIKREIFNGRALLKKAQSTLSFDDTMDVTTLPEHLEATKNAFSFLAVPEDFFDLSGNTAVRASSSNIRRLKTSFSKSVVKKIIRHSEVKASHPLVFKLVNNEEEVPNNFLQRILSIISKCKEGLHHQISKFTSQDLGRWTENNAGVSLKSAMKAKLQKGNSLFQEIESELNEIHRRSLVVWLDMINESLELFKNFENQVTIILNSECKKFENIWLSSIEVLEKQFHEELKEFERNSTKNKEEKKRRMKTMFGHPNHRERLSVMTHEAAEFCKSQTENLKTIILYRRNQVKQLLMMFFSERNPFLNDLYKKVEKVYENEELEYILYSLAQHLLGRSKGKKILNILIGPRQRRQHPQPTETKQEEDVASELSSNWKVALDVPALIKSVTEKLRRIISLKDDNAEKEMDDEFVIEEPDDYVLLCKSLKMSLLKTAMKICQLGKLALAVYIEEMQTWLSNWRTDCTRLGELYSIGPITTNRDKRIPSSKISHKHEAPRVPPTYSRALPKRTLAIRAAPALMSPLRLSQTPATLSSASTWPASQVRAIPSGSLSSVSHSRTKYSGTTRARR